MYELKIYRKVMCHENEEWYKIEEELTCCFKIDLRNFTNFDPSTRKSKKIVFYLVPCDQSIYCLSYKSTEELSLMTLKSFANFEEKLTCDLKILWLDKFLPGHLKVPQLRLWWDPLVQNRKGMSLKFTEELCVKTVKNNAKFEEELISHFKTDMRNLTNLTWALEDLKKIAL